jgi:colanic acid/amylovoran biosynthesis protein
MNIVVIGQCTLHWGRMEFGNIGNYYIIEPFFRQLHEVFPGATISTTMQLSDRFCNDEKVTILPMELYYAWDNDLAKAKEELEIAMTFKKGASLIKTTPYIDLVKKADLVIDFSGDIWGDNADFLGNDRFYVGLVKNRVAQIFAKKTVMIAGSPGPFKNSEILNFAKEVYQNFDLVTHRESISKGLLASYGFDTSRTVSLSCPAFLFEPTSLEEIIRFNKVPELIDSNRTSVGFLLCGWNFETGPFDKWPREDSDYFVFADAIEEFLEKFDCDIYLMSHSNGFPIPPEQFELIHGRDFPIMQQFFGVLNSRGLGHRVHLLDEVYNTWETKAILGKFDMVVSGRVHAAVGALSQNVPTVIIDYGHEPKAHKLRGFAIEAKQEKYLANPSLGGDLRNKMFELFENRQEVKRELENVIPKVKEKSKENFRVLKSLF